ncbi:TRAP transporter small permease [Pseudooceanicola sp. C21-150M6]|uniref:TRAP transporter small permease n=1 Tax=Pseudooceanicola sp. C21-150M6 TaxID=3434355 RepID=UPI003D7F47B8
MALLLRALDTVSRLMFFLGCLFVVAIVCIVNYDVLSRNLGLPTAIWAVNTVEYAMLHLTFLVLPYLVLTRGHVFVGVLLTYLPGRMRRYWEAGLHLLSAAICFYMMWYSGSAFLKGVADGSYEVRAYDMPMWGVYLTMPIGFLFGGLQFLAFFPRGQSFFDGGADAHAGL